MTLSVTISEQKNGKVVPKKRPKKVLDTDAAKCVKIIDLIAENSGSAGPSGVAVRNYRSDAVVQLR